MHYQSDITSGSKVWTREELERWLEKRLHGAKLILPDDEFYTNARSKDQIITLANKIKKQLAITKQVTYSISEHIQIPGNCSLEDKKIHITLSVKVFGNPLLTAACLSHLLAHGLLMSENRISIDDQENERLADIACLQSGLGIVVLNGVNKGGWRTRYSKKPLRNSPVLGYFTLQQFTDKLVQYIDKHSVNELSVGPHLVSWQRSQLLQTTPLKIKPSKFVYEAERTHKSSIRWFKLSVLAVCCFTGLAVYATSHQSKQVDPKLAGYRQDADNLRKAYLACNNQYESFKAELPKDQISSARLLSYEQVRCKSLQNRYNAASIAYNEYLKSKN